MDYDTHLLLVSGESCDVLIVAQFRVFTVYGPIVEVWPEPGETLRVPLEWPDLARGPVREGGADAQRERLADLCESLSSPASIEMCLEAADAVADSGEP